MWNFKKNLITAITPVNPNIDKEIHDAIMSAQDELLNHAQKILSERKTSLELGYPDFPAEKLELIQSLSSLGFENQPDVIKLKAELEVYKENKKEYDAKMAKGREIERLISKYSKEYPNNRFITKESIRDICNRFGLLFAPIGMYSDEIPLKNMKEIANFRVNELICPKTCDVYVDIDRDGSKKLFGINERHREKIKVPLFREDLGYWRFSGSVQTYLKERYGEENVRHFSVYSSENKHIEELVFKDREVSLSGGMMIAPKNKFKIPDGYFVENGFEVGYSKLVVVKDPVVLQPVIGGYLIVSAWGFESTLPEISGAPSGDLSMN